MRHDSQRRRDSALASVAVLALLGAAATAGSADWPRWRGPNRDGKSTETGLLESWPREGPKLLWTARGLGRGYATVSIANGLIYTSGDVGGKTIITALDLAGTAKWRAENGPAWTRSTPGARGTPTIDGDRLYHLNPNGDVVCLDAKTGKKIWALNMLRKFRGRNISWGLAESLLVDGDNVICCPGGRTAAVVALNKAAGETVWVCRGAGDKPGYASPILVEHKGLRQIVAMTSRAAIGVEAKTGRLLWRHEHKTAYEANATDPIFHDGHIFICSGYGSGSELLKLDVQGNGASVQRVWRAGALDNHHGGVILVDGHLYGSSHKRPNSGKWICLDFKTGEVKYAERGVGKGSVTYADGMFYTYSERGAVGLVKATPDGHEVVSRFRIPRGGRGPTWPHPVVCGGRLYLRHGDLLFCYDIRAK